VAALVTCVRLAAADVPAASPRTATAPAASVATVTASPAASRVPSFAPAASRAPSASAAGESPAAPVASVAARAAAAPGKPSAAASPATAAFDVEVFGRSGCPRCAEAERFLAELRREQPALRITSHDVVRDPAALARLRTLAARRGVRTLAVPAFLIGDELLIGFRREVSERQIRERLAGIADRTVGPADAVDTGLFGVVSARRLGLPLFTIALGLVDGVNPCAMFVLLFVLALLANLRDRTRMAVVGGTFVVVSGAAYFTFMVAWLNVFLVVGYLRWVEIVLGAVALALGVLNVKDFVAFGRGPSVGIPTAAKPRIYARVRGIVQAESLGAALAGAVVLAVLVNVVELLCTAGLPVVYTRILTMHDLPTWQHYAYLALYNVAYMADDTAMLLVAVATLGSRKLQEREGRWLKLVSGLVLIALGAALLSGRAA
jgi:hypothetical protein